MDARPDLPARPIVVGADGSDGSDRAVVIVPASARPGNPTPADA